MYIYTQHLNWNTCQYLTFTSYTIYRLRPNSVVRLFFVLFFFFLIRCDSAF